MRIEIPPWTVLGNSKSVVSSHEQTSEGARVGGVLLACIVFAPS